MGGKQQSLSGETCRLRWESPGNPGWKARLDLQESAEAIVPGNAHSQGKGRTPKRGADLMSSRDRQRKQNSWQQHCPRQEVAKSRGAMGGPSLSPAQGKDGTSGQKIKGLMERTLERDNMFRALERDEANDGAPGIDGIGVKALRPYLKENWPA